ncbi:TonB-dependent receptor family protein [Ampullimonas aquatilis]|uniref:TonB-dependent receptor family protein n=1 Tax=Ampullimonas aquatilis TaxID=1341549 RepID=UPI003C73E6D6
MKNYKLTGFASLMLTAFAAQAQTSSINKDAVEVTAPEVNVTATRVNGSRFNTGASIDVINSQGIHDDKLQVNLSESLGPVPGVQVRDRQNYAQDLQVSVRGFGARSTFGIRGVRLYVDGIPATLPDGQGQLSHIDLGSAERIEILRGPFSALYGNSSGGVMLVTTEEGRSPATITPSFAVGSDGMSKRGVKFNGTSGNLSFSGNVSNFKTDGYRDHSKTERNLANFKLSASVDERSSLTLVLNHLNLPDTQDPLGLTRAQFQANPRGVDASAISFNTRKSVMQTQGGVVYERQIDADNNLRVSAYYGQRNTVQYQSIPVATQNNPLHPGGVIVLGRTYQGVDGRWSHQDLLAGQPITIVGGLTYDVLDEDRRGYQNFIGTTLGVQGNLRRSEGNQVNSFDQYLQADWQFLPRFNLNLGVRHSTIKFDSTDHYIVGTNGNDSGSVDYSATLPVAGLRYAITPKLNVYATAGRGFETPTLNELSYRANGGTGLNFALQPARSRNAEVGVKARDNAWGEVTAALFETHTDNEIVTQTNSGGRATFQNAGKTKRQGLELSWQQKWQNDVRAQLAYTWLDAVYSEGFKTCAGTPCATPTLTIANGNKIPGIAKNLFYADLAYMPAEGLRGGVEVRYSGKVMVNDANTDAAASYTITSIHGGYVWNLSQWKLNAFARIDNLFDRQYIGSVIVNDGNGRFFEPAPGRAWMSGVSATYQF